MTSYQRRLQNIKYLEQCIRELEGICEDLNAQIPKPPLLKLQGNGIAGSDFITPYNNGEYVFNLYTIKRSP